jgi:hypothetical protein
MTIARCANLSSKVGALGLALAGGENEVEQRRVVVAHASRRSASSSCSSRTRSLGSGSMCFRQIGSRDLKAPGPRPKAQGPRPKAQGPRPKAQGLRRSPAAPTARPQAGAPDAISSQRRRRGRAWPMPPHGWPQSAFSGVGPAKCPGTSDAWARYRAPYWGPGWSRRSIRAPAPVPSIPAAGAERIRLSVTSGVTFFGSERTGARERAGDKRDSQPVTAQRRTASTPSTCS